MIPVLNSKTDSNVVRRTTGIANVKSHVKPNGQEAKAQTVIFLDFSSEQ